MVEYIKSIKLKCKCVFYVLSILLLLFIQINVNHCLPSRYDVRVSNSRAGFHPEGCKINGTKYAEGSAVPTQARCQYCYCIKGITRCIKPQCLLHVVGCTPIYNKHSCCPVKYNCSGAYENEIQTSTSIIFTTPSLQSSISIECHINGSTYNEGERILQMEEECTNCYCIKGIVRCDPVLCSVGDDTKCRPRTIHGQCCPSSYDCGFYDKLMQEGKTELDFYDHTSVQPVQSTENINNFYDNDDILSTLKYYENGVNDESNTTEFSYEQSFQDELQFTTEIATNNINNKDYYEDYNSSTLGTTTDSYYIHSTTMNNLIEKTLIPNIEALINKSKIQGSDYEYDYDDLSLPPSLPNLRIIPFVAADALPNNANSQNLEHRTSSTNKLMMLLMPENDQIDSAYFNNPNGFSPPAETEGGFMPRDPIIDGPFYESKFNLDSIKSTIRTTTDSINNNSENCFVNGQIYHNNQITSKTSDCKICICYYGVIRCKELECNSIPTSAECHDIFDISSCCNRLSCNNFNKDGEYTSEKLTINPLLSYSNNSIVSAMEIKNTQAPVELLNSEVNETKFNDHLKNNAETTGLEKDPNIDFSLGGILDLLFGGDDINFQRNTLPVQPETTPLNSNNLTSTSTEMIETKEAIEPEVNGFILKLAGCNIYGKTYRVGEFIVELSDNCKECFCSHIGVKCNDINMNCSHV